MSLYKIYGDMRRIYLPGEISRDLANARYYITSDVEEKWIADGKNPVRLHFAYLEYLYEYRQSIEKGLRSLLKICDEGDTNIEMLNQKIADLRDYFEPLEKFKLGNYCPFK